MTDQLKPSQRARFWSRVDRGTYDRCWPWKGSLASAGYGYISFDNHRFRAHRIAYELVKGEIPDGLVIDHLCRNRACCNPAHLEAVSNRTNVLRGVGPSAEAAVKTHCSSGHSLLDDGDVYIDADGHRNCRVCRRIREFKNRPSRSKRGLQKAAQPQFARRKFSESEAS